MRQALKARLAIWIFGTLLAACACGTGDQGSTKISGKTLTIYGSVPLNGASRVSARAVLDGARLALAQAGDHVGKYRVLFKALDDSTPQRAGWDPGQTTQNARLAASDPTTIGYLGELNSGASAIAIPLLNRAGIPQVSPTNTAVGLTISSGGSSPGEPEKYYPTGVRTYARVVPNDVVQANVQVRLQRSLGCKSTYVLDDGEVDGADTATTFTIAAQAAGLPVIASQSFDPRATDYSGLAVGVAQSGADCVLISAMTESNAVLLTQQLAAALPHARIFATSELAESTYANPAKGGIPLALDPRVLITSPTLAPHNSPAGQAFFATYSRRDGAPEPDAIFGYESMNLLLAAISRATAHGSKPAQRSKVLGAIFSTRRRRSVLGTYSIDRNGDTSLRDYGVYRLVAGKLYFWIPLSG